MKSEETINKWRESRKGYTHSPETRKKISEKGKGKPAWNKGKPLSPETRKKISLANTGRKLKPRTNEHKRNLSLAIKKLYNENYNLEKSLETRKKISLANTGRKHSPETRKKISDGVKKSIQKFNHRCKNTKPEIEAEKILKKYNLNYKKQFRINYLNTVKLYDFLLTDYNILLEIDGTYWHGKGIKDEDIKSERLKDCRNNDKLKDKLAQDNGYTLIRIWSDEMFKLEEYCSKELFYRKKEAS